MNEEPILVFGGTGSPKLTRNICSHLGVEPGKNETLRFSEGNLFVRILENVRGRNVYLIQSTGYQANDNFMELLFWIDACNRASAASVTVVMPYFTYAKGDKKDEPRVSIRARVCADAIESVGADRIVTMDLHAAQVQGFFKLPVDDLYALPILCDAIKKQNLPDLVVVSPDAGFVKKARKYASYLGAPLAIGDKVRTGHDEDARVMDLIGDVKNKTAIVVDDVVISGGTLVNISSNLIQRGARSVYVLVTHGAFSKGAMERLEQSTIQKLYVTDTIETQPVEFSDKIEIISVAPLFAEAIRRIHNQESVSVLFET
ncbi:MAG: ribose-phosphate pyrophosphokinase [bacterium]|nr:ribose-phosphate pyrophosphokinase [bacterium]